MLVHVFPFQHKALELSAGFFLIFNPRPCPRLLLLPTSYCQPLNNVLPVPLERDFPPALLFAVPVPLPKAISGRSGVEGETPAAPAPRSWGFPIFFRRWFRYHVGQTLFHVVQVVLGYMVMLAVMSYNAWIFLGAIAGSTLGYFVVYPLLGRG